MADKIYITDYNNKNIDNWKDFQSTWKKVDFSQEHNALNQEALESFWKT